MCITFKQLKETKVRGMLWQNHSIHQLNYMERMRAASMNMIKILSNLKMHRAVMPQNEREL